MPPELAAQLHAAAVALLDAVLPADVTGLGQAVHDLLADLAAVGSEIEEVLTETEYALILLGAAIGLGGYEFRRRRWLARTAAPLLPNLTTEST
jgi:hypothetical protein